MQTGQYSYVRGRPAAAGEGRYFVRVPEGWLLQACAMVHSACSVACVRRSEYSAHTHRDEFGAFQVGGARGGGPGLHEHRDARL